jgi:hypothetical protein
MPRFSHNIQILIYIFLVFSPEKTLAQSRPSANIVRVASRTFFPLYSEGANERTRPEKLSGEVSCHPPLRATTGKTARHFKDNESYPPVIWKEPMHNGKIVKFFGAASTGLPGNNHQISGAHEN